MKKKDFKGSVGITMDALAKVMGISPDVVLMYPSIDESRGNIILTYYSPVDIPGTTEIAEGCRVPVYKFIEARDIETFDFVSELMYLINEKKYLSYLGTNVISDTRHNAGMYDDEETRI
ncbi:hypothetical protein ACK8P5_26630 (plasmid) [Paenibacillus sp. EC2-1]|uniref:hypothetical protein n=1 Tax=Paenibacillus sp. EC2-1 TaxID=3388665 RepID=UPI003BEF4918